MTMTSSSPSSPEIQDIEVQDRFSYKLATHDEVLDDLSSRFILNLPDDELSSLERICFQVEQAHWFYEDFIREENPKFPSLPLKRFSEMLFQACPLLQQWSHDHELAYTNFMQYKTRVPVCGAIMLNDTWEKCVLVKGWKASSGWGFPKGKINQVEPPANCAIRELEVLEETGYNLAGQLNPDHVIEMSIREQKISLFIVPGVPENYPFKTKTRKEISKIEWFRLADLPTWKRNKTSAGRFYLISPFIGPLKAFITANKPRSPPQIKSKKAQLSVSRGVPINSEDLVRESSSHSSSTENGEIKTPLLQCSNASMTLPPQSPDKETMDPHFAALLSALADSVFKKGTHNVVSTSNTPSVINFKDIDHTVSTPATSPPETLLGANFHRSFTKPPAPRPSSSPVSHFSIGVPVNSPSAPTAVDFAESEVPPKLLKVPGKLSQIPPMTDSTSHGNLFQQHVALLDAVSKESARMQEAYKTAAVNGVIINDNFLNPIIATTARPSSLIPRSHADALKYPESTGSAPPSFLTSHNMNSSLISGEPPGVSRSNTTPYRNLQGRIRTSLANRSDQTSTSVSGSASMDQTELLALMNGVPMKPTTLHSDYALPPPSPTSLLTPYRAMALEPQLPPFTQQLPSTLSAHSSSSAPLIDSYTPTQALPAASNALLSILNSGRMSLFSNLPTYSPGAMEE
ncbi:hypothetical protein C0993_000614 [Termitomyces sp. T159_Od127]|nr:hypothetical protein C0993_000614 [Termitomyces sp. T159_Od127]